MNPFSSPANDFSTSGRKFVPGLGWIDMDEGLDKYLKLSNEDLAENVHKNLPEFGWDEVHCGLGQILIGHIVWSVCALLTVVLAWMLSTGAGAHHLFHVTGVFKDDFKLYGLVFIGLVAAVGYRFLLCGMWRCLLNAPERNGLRWIMFACITGIATAPIFQTTAFLTAGPLNGEPRSTQWFTSKKSTSTQLRRPCIWLQPALYFLAQ